MSIKDALGPVAAVVAVDVGKTMAAVLVTDAARQRLLGPLDFPMTVTGVSEVISKTRSVVPAGVTRVGVEAAGHYHRPLASPVVWPDWELVELNPAHVTEQRRVMGRRPGEDRCAGFGGDDGVSAGRARCLRPAWRRGGG